MRLRTRVFLFVFYFIIQDTGFIPGYTRKVDQVLVNRFRNIITGTVSGTTGRYEGTGHGFSLCKNLVELQSGSLPVTRNCGNGSEFGVL